MSQLFEIDVDIPADGLILAGRLIRNTPDLTQTQPGLVVSGSWLTVKEQMASTYGRRMAALGYTVLIFDFAGWGQSAGPLPLTEVPRRKIADMTAAARFMSTLSCVRADAVGYLAICASAMYAATAIVEGAPIDAFAAVAGWFHNSATVAPFYGGAEGIAARLARAEAALQKRRRTGEVTLVPAYAEGDERAGMSFPMDYYANPARGAVTEWPNKMSEESWTYWLTFDGVRAGEALRTPTLFVHGDECALPDNVKHIHHRMHGHKKLIWRPGFQAEFYDRADLVDLSVEACDAHFRAHLGGK